MHKVSEPPVGGSVRAGRGTVAVAECDRNAHPRVGQIAESGVG